MRTSDGLEFNIAPLRMEHEKVMRQLLLVLDQTSRWHRFGCAASDSYVVAHVGRAFATAAWLAGAFVAGELRGVVELYAGAALDIDAAFVTRERLWT